MNLTRKLKAVGLAGILGASAILNSGCLGKYIDKITGPATPHETREVVSRNSTESLYPPIPVGYVKFGVEGKNYIRDPETFRAYELNLSKNSWEPVEGYRVLNDKEIGIIQFRVMGKNDFKRDINGSGTINPLTEMRSKDNYTVSETPVNVTVIFQDAPKYKTLNFCVKSYQNGPITSVRIRPDLGIDPNWNSGIPLVPGEYSVYIEDPATRRYIGGIDFKVAP